MLDFDPSLILPAAYAAWRPLVRDGLAFFVSRLRPARRTALLQEQMALRHAPQAERLVAALRHCPTLHKLGQLLARDRRLDAGLRRRLQSLESVPCTRTAAEIQAWIPDARVRIDGPPLAEGSVAVVAPFNGAGVVKLLKPGIIEDMDEEIAIWADLGAWLEARCEAYGLPPLDYAEVVSQVFTLLLHELCLETEQENLARIARLYANDPWVVVPSLLPASSASMTAMSRIDGVKVTDGPHARETAERLAHAVLARPFFDGEFETVFHADPHAGNVLLTPDGRIGLIDWSLVAFVGKEERAGLVGLLMAAQALDPRQGVAALRRLGGTVDAARVPLEGLFRNVRRRGRVTFSDVMSFLDEAMLAGALTLPPDLVLLRKALLNLENVLGDLYPGFDAAEVVLEEGVRRLTSEWPDRLATPYDSNDFETHLSNADLVGLVLDWPCAAGRWWLGLWGDLLRT